jgi:dynein heavy chain 2
LGQEREVLLGQLVTYIARIRDDFETRSKQVSSSNTEDKPLLGRNLPEIVNNIVWARQILNKAEHIISTAQSLLSDLPRISNFHTSSNELLADLKSYQQEQYNFWVKGNLNNSFVLYLLLIDMEDALDNPDQPLALQMTGRLMEFDFSDGTLKVNYSERLVSLLREVRQLTALGFKVSRKIRAATDNAQKFYRHGIILKQVANFYNTIKTQLIPCQMPMLRESAEAFEQIVKVNKHLLNHVKIYLLEPIFSKNTR